MSLFARKTVDQCIADGASGGGLKRSLGSVQLTALGVGAIIGAGIFVAIGSAITGDSAHPGAGSAIVISILVAGVTSALAAITIKDCFRIGHRFNNKTQSISNSVFRLVIILPLLF